MSHSLCLIGVRSAAATLPARRWADMVDEECALPATIPRTPPVELPALPGEGQVSYQLPAASETTKAWLPAQSTVVDTAPRSAPRFNFQSFSSADSGGTAGLFMVARTGSPSEMTPTPLSENQLSRNGPLGRPNHHNTRPNRERADLSQSNPTTSGQVARRTPLQPTPTVAPPRMRPTMHKEPPAAPPTRDIMLQPGDTIDVRPYRHDEHLTRLAQTVWREPN